MNKSSVSKILNKAKLTGAEVGKIYILNTIAEIEGFKRTGKTTPIITQNELDNAISKIMSDAYQLETYNNFIGLQNLSSKLHPLFVAYGQQIENGFNKLLLGITVDLWKADIDEYKSNLPLIMTEEKYNQELETSKKEYKDGKASYYNLFFSALRYYAGTVSTEKNILSNIFDSYKDQYIKDKTLINLYKERFLHTNFCLTEGNGYYTLIDGTDSREVTLKEYITDFLKRPLFKGIKAEEKTKLKDRYFNEFAGIIGNDNGAIHELSEEYQSKFSEVMNTRTPDAKAEPIRVFKFIEIVRNYFNTQEGKEDFISELDQIEIDSFILTYKVDKQDLILYNDFIYYLYEENEENAKLLDHYLKELPEVKKIINEDIAEKLGLSTIDYFEATANYFKDIATYEDLYNQDIYNFQKNYYWYFQDNNGQQAQRNGIAIIQEESLYKEYKNSHFIDGTYAYEPKYKYIEMLRLLSNGENTSNKQVIKDYIENGFIYIYAILSLLEDIEEAYKLEGLKTAYSGSISHLEAQIKLFNTLKVFYMLPEERHSNKDILKKLENEVTYIDLTSYKPSKEVRKKAREFISDIKNFSNAGNKVNKFLSLYSKPQGA